MERATIDPRKLASYMLDVGHPRGGGKARFLTRFGFTPAEPDVLATALRDHASDNPVVRTESRGFGMVYEVEGRLRSPNGRNPTVRVVWMIDTGASEPRLITLVPRTGRRTP